MKCSQFKEAEPIVVLSVKIRQTPTSLNKSYMQYIAEFDGQKNQAMGKQEDHRVYRRRGTYLDRLYMSESNGPESTTKYTQ